MLISSKGKMKYKTVEGKKKWGEREVDVRNAKERGLKSEISSLRVSI